MNIRRNFFNNFSNANGNSLDIQKDILLDEISQLISKHKPLVIEALNRSGANIESSISDKKTASLVVDYMYKSKDFQDDMVMLIVSLNSELLNADFSSADGENKEKAKAVFSKIGSFFSGIFKRKNKKTDGGSKVGGGDVAGNIAQSTASGGAAGGALGAIVGLVGGVTTSVFNWKASKNQLAAEKESAKSELYQKLLGGDKKTNWMPIIVVGGVFLVGAIILITTLKRK